MTSHSRSGNRPANTLAHAAQTLLVGISLVVSVGSPILPFFSFALRSVVSICKTTTREEVVLTYFTAGQDPRICMSMKLAKLKIFEVNPQPSPASPSSDRMIYTRTIMWRPRDSVCAMIALSGALVITNGSVQAAGDPVSGKDIASRRCAQCHLVDGGRARGAAPPLPAIGGDVSWTDDRLATFLTKPHGGVRGFSFSRQEIDNLVAYIRSLEPH